MHVRARFFASYRELVGASELEFEVPPGATVAEALSRLRARDGGFGRLPTSVAVAVNREYATPDRGLEEGDELALLPPVAGG